MALPNLVPTFLKGKHCTLMFLLAQDNGRTENLIIQAKNATIKPKGEEIADSHLGDRPDLDFELEYYEVTFDCMLRDLKLLRAFLIHQEQRDLQVAMALSACALLVRLNDSEKEAFQLRNFCLDTWEFNIAGRTERVMVPVRGRANDFKPIKAASPTRLTKGIV